MKSNRIIRAPVAFLLAVVSLSLAGCEAVMPFLFPEGKKPSARIADWKVQDLTLESVSLLFDVEIANPAAVSLPLLGGDYALASTGKSFLSGSWTGNVTVPSGGSKTIQVPAKVGFAELLGALQGVKPGTMLPFRADFKAKADVPGVGPVELPFSQEGELPVPAPPKVTVKSLQVDSLSINKMDGRLILDVENPNPFTATLSGLSYGLELLDTPIVKGSVDEEVPLETNTPGTVEIPVSFSPTKLGLAGFRAMSGSDAGFRLTGDVKLGTPFGPLSSAFDRKGKLPLSRTK